MLKYRLTLLLLCLGYFIDFYDLTIFSVSYSDIIRDLFFVTEVNQVQRMFLWFTNCHTAGIIFGGIVFGIVGDKIGRAKAIKYSIAVYSCAIILSCYTHSATMFAILRFITGFGLATEYATSSVLIGEMFPYNASHVSTGVLYLSGILGGIVATILGGISWKIMFFCGGIGGALLCFFRDHIKESPLFKKTDKTSINIYVFHLLKDFSSITQLLKLVIIILPFYFLISVMFIIPRFMNLNMILSESIHRLLFCFFAGNIISTLATIMLVKLFKDFRPYLWCNILLFLTMLGFFPFVNSTFFSVYSVMLGLIGGGLPIVWIQIVTKNYGTNYRSTATNFIYIIGRGTMILFNILISCFMFSSKNFYMFVLTMTVVIAILNMIVIAKSKNIYSTNMDYLI